MTQMDEKNLSFVLRHYRPGMFDAQAVWEKLSGTRRRSPLRFLWALTVAAALLLGTFLFWRNDYTEYHSYDVAQAFTLADGTHVTLAPGAMLRYQPHRDSRQVSMAGKVLYEVSNDEAHPFVVSAPSATVTVLGTVFQVRADEEGARVDVTEGRVRFCGTAGESLVLTAGEGASLQEGIPVREVSTFPNPSAWATGIFRYEATPLETVLEELSAFYGISLSTEARGKRLSGSFSTESLDEILSLVQAALDIQIDKK